MGLLARGRRALWGLGGSREGVEWAAGHRGGNSGQQRGAPGGSSVEDWQGGECATCGTTGWLKKGGKYWAAEKGRRNIRE